MRFVVGNFLWVAGAVVAGGATKPVKGDGGPPMRGTSLGARGRGSFVRGKTSVTTKDKEVLHRRLMGPMNMNPKTPAPSVGASVFLDPEFGAVDPGVFKWLLVENNVGSYEGYLNFPENGANSPLECDPELSPNYPEGCEWPSIRTIKATAPIYGSGDSLEWDSVTPLFIPAEHAGKYMVTVMAEGYRLCGGYFTVTGEQETVTVRMVCQEHPLPLGTIRMFVFEDNKPCNGQYDPGEKPLFDFGIGINDIEGPVTEDYYGNSLLDIVSLENGMIEVPNMWPGRYDIDVGPPPNEGWIKTNTLEGGHGWDYWLYEGWDGFDNEFVVGNEVFPWAVAGYTKVKNEVVPGPDPVTVTGKVLTASPWPNGINFAEVNTAIIGPNLLDKGEIFNQDGLIAISDLSDGDTTKYVAKTDPDGSFSVQLPKGPYTIAYFDITQLYILRFKTFTIPADQVGSYDIGNLYLTGWYTEIQGHFFIDTNGDGKYDRNTEQGLSNGPFPVLRLRDGTQVDRGFQFEVPFSDKERLGFYSFRHAYPFASWLTMHMFHPDWELTGYTYQIEPKRANGQDTTVTVQNDKNEYSIAIFGTPGVATRLDVGFRPKSVSTTGSIFGGVHYDTTRTNLDASQAVVENHEPGIPGVEVKLFALPTNNGCNKRCEPDTETGFGYVCPGENTQSQGTQCIRYHVGAKGETRPHPALFQTHSAGDVKVKNKNKPVKVTRTAEFETPMNCKVTDQENNILAFREDQSVVPEVGPCIETPLLRNQVGGFARPDGTFQFDNIEPGYYAVQIIIPPDRRGDPAYKLRTENDINTYESDLWEGPGGPLCPSLSDQCPMPEDPSMPNRPCMQNVKNPCAGEYITVETGLGLEGLNPTFALNGGSYHPAGTQVHKCDIKIVLVEEGHNSKVNFNLFTDVPIPGRFKGIVLDDRLPQANRKANLFTELKGVPHIPVGVRDFKGTQLTNVETDANGYYEVLVPPSRNNANAPSGSSIMAGMWCLTANDPGSPGLPSATPRLQNYRPITACFEGLPGRIIPVDLAPVTVTAPLADATGDLIEAPCGTPVGKPEFYNVHNGDPLVEDFGPICTGYPCLLEIRGRSFSPGSTPPAEAPLPIVSLLPPNEQPTGQHGTKIPPSVDVLSWADMGSYESVMIEISLPQAGEAYGMYQLELVHPVSSQAWFNGISIHLIGGNYNPVVYDTSSAQFEPSVTEGRIQRAIDFWEGDVGNHFRGGIILIRPNDNHEQGVHLENLIMGNPPVKLQGIGPGKDGSSEVATIGTRINGGNFAAGTLCLDDPDLLFCDAVWTDAYRDRLISKAILLSAGADIVTNALVEGSVLYVLSNSAVHMNGPTNAGWINEASTGGVDGLVLTGGTQEKRAPLNPTGGNIPEVVAVQGGAIALHSYTKFFRITNNVIKENSGSYGGAIRVGTAFLDQETGGGDSVNTELTISHNTILYNGGFILAGAIGLFGGTKNYVVDTNYICGNSGQEYGGGISHFGASDGGRISNNWILWCRSVDEGAGIIIASETLSVESGAPYPEFAGDVTITDNVIQGCISGDDGGGLRFLNPGLSEYLVTNNVITHNVAMHEGGGVSINDAPYVEFTGNHVMYNIVTGTAVESSPTELFAAGLATAGISDDLLPLFATPYPHTFSHPQAFSNNIFWDNRASNGVSVGSDAAGYELEGLGMMNAATWLVDMKSSDNGQLQPMNSIIQSLDCFYEDVPPCSPLNSPFTCSPVDTPPFECDSSLSADPVVPPVNDALAWGNGFLTIQVQGQTATLAGQNTFIVVPTAEFPPGPIGGLSSTTQRRELVSDDVSNSASETIQSEVLVEEPQARDLEANTEPMEKTGSEKCSHLWVWIISVSTLVSLSLVLMGKKLTTTDHVPAGEFDYEDREESNESTAMHTVKDKRGLRRLLWSLAIGLGFSNQAMGDDCTVDCVDFGTPIPPQVKYQSNLMDYIPKVIDLRNRCGEHIDMYMKKGLQDWGIKDNGNTLLTPIYGYTYDETLDPTLQEPTFPGPTILTKRGCVVNVTFHNLLGDDEDLQHMFELDRSVGCGLANLDQGLCDVCKYTTFDGALCPAYLHGLIDRAPPDLAGDPEFYCRCVSQRGSELRATVHLHGGYTQPWWDGHPESWYTLDINGERDSGHRFDESGFINGNERVMKGENIYDNNQEGATLFYHDHALGITRLNVYAGLAGLYVIDDDRRHEAFEDILGLSGDDAIYLTVKRDIPLALMDKLFSHESANEAPMVFPVGISDGDGGELPPFSILPEVFGYTMTVNGVIYPYLEVDNDGFYLFRLLNACDSRFLRLYFEKEDFEKEDGERLDFTVVANDQGLLANTPIQNEILLGPAERYEIIITFKDVNVGENVILRNNEITLLGPVIKDQDDRFMQFRVLQGGKITPTGDLPTWTDQEVPHDTEFQDLISKSQPEVLNDHILADFFNKRELWITERTQILVDENTASGGRPLPMLGSRAQPFGQDYEEDVTEINLQNKPTVWELLNLSNDAHVIHLHQVRFRIVSRQDVGLSYDTFQSPNGMYRQYAKNAEPPEDYEAGPKDTVISYPGSVTKIIMIFDIPGRYVWHCHILSHEDNMMMREFITESDIPASAYLNAAGNAPPGQNKVPISRSRRKLFLRQLK